MMFPDWGQAETADTGAALPLYTEWAVDWDRGAFALRNGKPYTVTGNEALKVWVRCALHPQSCRFLCSAHGADYGNQLAACMASTADAGILESLLRREIRETLLVSPYIRQVDGFAFTREGSCLTVGFTVHTVYEDMTMGMEVLLP